LPFTSLPANRLRLLLVPKFPVLAGEWVFFNLGFDASCPGPASLWNVHFYFRPWKYFAQRME
jgi:hypothetical protein